MTPLCGPIVKPVKDDVLPETVSLPVQYVVAVHGSEMDGVMPG
jgi:hypothetical protein